MNPFAPSCKILTACLWQRGLAAGVIILERANLVGACAERLQTLPRQAANQMQIVARLVALVIFLFALGSGCSTNGHYADGLDHWPVQVHSVDSGGN